MKKVCFLSIDDTSGFEIDDDLAIPHLKRLGINVETVSWHADENWSRFDAVLVRTTWDYHKQPRAFVEKLTKIDQETLLLNPLRTISWNINKLYLRELLDLDVPVVPTLFESDPIDEKRFESFQKRLGSEELIVKPTVSATAFNTFRLKRYSDELHVFGGEVFLVQPFVESVLEDGEFSLFYFNGQVSHAVQKRPKADDFRVQEDFGGLIEGIDPDPELLEVGAKVIRAVEDDLLYARVDLIRTKDEKLRLMELELIEPALYFRCFDGSANNFAKAVSKRLDEL